LPAITATEARATLYLLDEVASRINPYQTSPLGKKLVGDLAGMYSRRINVQHRLVCQIIEQEKIVKVLRMWSRYE
jgi:Txe/YoeB family toxin of toxin-antitoxin system